MKLPKVFYFTYKEEKKIYKATFNSHDSDYRISWENENGTTGSSLWSEHGIIRNIKNGFWKISSQEISNENFTYLLNRSKNLL